MFFTFLPFFYLRQQHCAQIFASRGGEQYSAVCIIQADTHTCVAGISVPDHWWDTSNSTLRSQDVHVYYDISLVEENQECASVSNTIIPGIFYQGCHRKMPLFKLHFFPPHHNI